MKHLDYYRPQSLDEALALKGERGAEALFIAGGTDVMVLGRQKKLDCAALISLRGLAELTQMKLEGDTFFLGAGVTLSRILNSPEAARHLPILHDAVQVMGSTQMRNVATVGGNVMTAASSGDTLGPLLCLEAVCRLVSAQGERRVPMHEMFTGPRVTAARADEILLGLDIPLPTSGDRKSSGCFIKLMRRAALDLALINVSVQLWLDEAGETIAKARVAAGVVAPTPVRLVESEEALEGAPLAEALKEQAADHALGRSCRPRDSDRCSSWYREEMVRVLVPRAAGRALNRMGIDAGQVG